MFACVVAANNGADCLCPILCSRQKRGEIFLVPAFMQMSNTPLHFQTSQALECQALPPRSPHVSIASRCGPTMSNPINPSFVSTTPNDGGCGVNGMELYCDVDGSCDRFCGKGVQLDK